MVTLLNLYILSTFVGGWSSWEELRCDAECGGTMGGKPRHRKCDDPVPLEDHAPCQLMDGSEGLLENVTVPCRNDKPCGKCLPTVFFFSNTHKFLSLWSLMGNGRSFRYYQSCNHFLFVSNAMQGAGHLGLTPAVTLNVGAQMGSCPEKESVMTQLPCHTKNPVNSQTDQQDLLKT